MRSSRDGQWSDFSEIILCETLGADAPRMKGPEVGLYLVPGYSSHENTFFHCKKIEENYISPDEPTQRTANWLRRHFVNNI